METPGDFLVEEDIAHGLFDLRIEADRELTDVAGAGVSVKNLVDSLGIVGCGFDDFTVVELKFHIVKSDALVNGRGVVTDDNPGLNSSPER